MVSPANVLQAMFETKLPKSAKEKLFLFVRLTKFYYQKKISVSANLASKKSIQNVSKFLLVKQTSTGMEMNAFVRQGT